MKKLSFHLLLVGFLVTGLGHGNQEPEKTGFLRVNNGSLYHEFDGQGDETVVFVHDGLVHGAVWDNQFSVFAIKYKVVRYDRRGYGRSPQPTGAYSNTDDLHQVFKSLEIDEAILIGMSAGGGLAIDYTLEHPERVSALVVVGAVVSGFGYSDHFLTRGGRIDASYYADPQRLLEYLVKEDPYEMAPRNTEVREDLWKLMEANPHNIDFLKNNLARQPGRPAIDALNEIRVPTLIVIGEYDIPDVFVHAGAIESGIPSAKKIIIRNAGHLVPLEQPEPFNKHVLYFLDSAEFHQALNTKGVREAVSMFMERRKEDAAWTPFSEAEMNALGYQYLYSGKAEDALELFKLNVLAYPESANVYDSLGEAYMANGDREPAIWNYERSLELDPGNRNARERLERLK